MKTLMFSGPIFIIFILITMIKYLYLIYRTVLYKILILFNDFEFYNYTILTFLLFRNLVCSIKLK